MRVSKEHKEKVRQRILEAAGRGFREKGYGGLGVDGLAKRADLTSGAFYGHFASKDEAFKAAVIQGLRDYAEALQDFQASQGDAWTQAFLDYYLGQGHLQDLSCGCAVPGLSAEVTRADADTKQAYEDQVVVVADTVAQGLGSDEPGNAWALLALLAGSVMMARSVQRPETAQQILQSARQWAEQMVSGL